MSRVPPVVPRAFAGLALSASLVVLASWWLGVESARSLLPGFPTMKANTALGLALLGVSLWIVAPRPASGGLRVALLVMLGVVGVLAGGSLVEYALGVDLRIDQLLATDDGSPFTPNPGRMSPVTAVLFLLMGASLLTLDAASRSGRLVSQAALHGAGALLMLAATGFVFDALVLAGATKFTTGIALPTILTFVTIGTGILVARPQRGIVHSLLDRGHEGILARRLFPVSLGLPFALGALAWMGVTLGAYPAGFALGLTLTALTAGLLFATWGTIHAISRAEKARAAVDAELKDAHASLEQRVRERTAQLEAATEELRRSSVTRQLAKRVLDIGQQELSSSGRRALGRALGHEAWRDDIPMTLAAFGEMGAGRLAVVEDVGDRIQVSGEQMLETVPGSKVATCALALGFVEGALEARRGEPTLGVETRCRSQGHSACEFVVKVKLPQARRRRPEQEPTV